MDARIWLYRPSGVYSTNSAYISRFSEEGLEELNTILLEVGKLKMPKKVAFLFWRAMRNRLPTKDNLRMHGIIVEESEAVCPFCHQQCETLNHISITCEVVHKLWMECYR